ncbi:MAG TPA: hypothetical protein VER11_22845 [Polyangiaceae bacterium]|nr:hypothetical protein [Polyangiaceae bacterium]
MNEVSTLEISVRYPNGTRQTLTVDSATALVGSGSHCEIRLPSEDAAVEQLRLSSDAAGVFGQVRSLERSVTLNGVPFVEGRLLSGGVLSIGRVELTVSVVETQLARGQTKHKKDSGSSAIYALAMLGFPLGFYLVLSHQDADAALPNEVQPPPLFATASATQCPESEHDAALAVATEERRRAETARERAPFSGQDAVNAVVAFRRSAACFTRADVGQRASDSALQADSLQRDVEREFHVHRVRLERALATKSYEEARTEVRLLLSYIGRHSGAYANWLLSLDRQIELKFAGKKS